jgi:ribosomal protein S18 acetylase RimI-like enzyme
MATAPRARGRGAGTAVLAALLDYAAALGAQRVWCNVRIGARSLYQRAGFRVTSEVFELPEIGPHVVMELKLDSSRPGA